MKAKYVQRGDSFDYIPSADVKAGDVIVLGDLVGIAKLDIPAGKLGSLAVCGIFDFVKKASEAVTAGMKVYWDGEVATATEGETVLGHTVAAAGANDETVRVLINV